MEDNSDFFLKLLMCLASEQKSDETEDFRGIIYLADMNDYKVLKGIGTRPEEESYYEK